VFAEYTKKGLEEIPISITVWNRRLELAMVHLLPHFWFRNQWRWEEENTKPAASGGTGVSSIEADRQYPGKRYFYADGGPSLTMNQRPEGVRPTACRPITHPARILLGRRQSALTYASAARIL